MSAAESSTDAAAAPPSADLLLYLAEFGDDTGAVDDPIAVDRALADPDAATTLKPRQPREPGARERNEEPE